MCGIAGILSTPGGPPIDLERLKSMIAMLSHRGPDGYGLFRDADIGLAHSRLSIIDLDAGFQPLTGEDRSVWLAFNGEIFNYIELRELLQGLGHRFASAGDSEVVVHLYEQFGESAWPKLNGQFAFALWDGRGHRLWLVRDRVGILPIYYAKLGTQLVFASEVKAILASGALPAQIDPQAVQETFVRWSVRAPRSIFAGIRSVRAGTAMCFDTALYAVEKPYWALDFTIRPGVRSLPAEAVADALGEALDTSVRLRLRSDVPVGAYLSGGLDSSVVSALARSVQGAPLETFSIRFADEQYDESREQRRVADFLGTRHHEIVCGDAEIRDSLEAVIWHCESPLLRTGPIPLFLLSDLVRSSGMKVVLTGEGADELFGGYSIFKEAKVRRFWARDPLSEARSRLLARVHAEVSAGTARNSGLWREFFAKNLTDVDDPYYSHRIRWANSEWTLRVLSPEVRHDLAPPDPELPPSWSRWEPLAWAQWLEIETFMTPYLLPYQGDRVAMAHGVEVRYPFLDPNVVDLASGLPTELKMPGLRDKVTLRRLAERMLPGEIASRPKVPYRAPMLHPFFAAAAGHLTDVLAEDECRRFGMVDAAAAAELLKKVHRGNASPPSEREQMALAGALTLQVLARLYLDEFRDMVVEARRALESLRLHVLEDRIGPASRGVRS